MDFESSDKVKLLQEQLERFMDDTVYPNETEAIQQIEESMETDPPLMKEIRGKAKAVESGMRTWRVSGTSSPSLSRSSTASSSTARVPSAT